MLITDIGIACSRILRASLLPITTTSSNDLEIGFQTDDDFTASLVTHCDLTGFGAIAHKTHGKRTGACGISEREIPMLDSCAMPFSAPR